MTELCFNIWYYLDKQQRITAISAREYLLAGEDSEKSRVLEILSRNDYKIVSAYDLPKELEGRHPEGVWYGFLKELGIEVFYRDVFEEIRRSLPSTVSFPEDKLYFATPLFDFGEGYVPAEIGDGFITEKRYSNSASLIP